MKNQTITLALSMACASLLAQDFGRSQTSVPVIDGPSIQQMQEVMAAEIAPATTASEAIQNYLDTNKKGIRTGYDEEANSVIVMEKIQFNIKNPTVSTDYLNVRTEKMSELMLKAKSKVIEAICTEMTAFRQLSVPGNLIQEQLDKQMTEEQKELKLKIQDVAENLKSLGKQVDAAEANLNELSLPDCIRWVGELLPAALKDASPELGDAAGKVAGRVADSLEARKKAYEAAQTSFKAAEELLESLQEKAEEIKGTVTAEMKTGIDKISQMPIIGCSILKQAESFTEENGLFVYEIAILFSWSQQMQDAASKILAGEEVSFAPGKKDVRQWLAGKAASGELASMVGSRTYIDNQGKMWFMGISSAPVTGRANKDEEYLEIAQMEASAEVGFALFADAMSARHLEKVMQDVRNADGTDDTKVAKAYSKAQGESFKDIALSGVAELTSRVVTNPLTGLKTEVVVYGVSSGNAKALSSIATQSRKLGIQVKKVQAYVNAKVAAEQNAYEKVDTSADKAAGAAAGAQAVKPTPAAVPAVRQTNKKPTGPAGQLRVGTIVFDDDDD